MKQVGLNEIAREKRQSARLRLLDTVKNPLVILFTALGVLSYLTGDLRAMMVIFVMALLGYVILTQGVKTWFSRGLANDLLLDNKIKELTPLW